MATTKLTGTLIRSGSIPTTALGGGVISSSVQINTSLPGGVVSSSAQVQSLLPGGAVSSSGQVALNGITGTTFATANFTFPQNLTVGGTLTAQEIQTEYVTSSIIFESGSTKFGDTADDTHQFTGSLSVLGTISGALVLPVGVVTASSQIDITSTTNYSTFSSSIATKNDLQDISINALSAATSSYAINSTIQSQLAGVASSSAQVKAYLPDGSVSSSAQYPGWVTASSQIDYNSITNKLSGVVSSSAQVQPLLPGDTVTSSAQVKAFLPADTVSSSGQVSITATTGYSTFSSSLATVDVGQTTRIDNLASLTSSYAINSTIQSQLAGVVSSSTQVKPLLPDGTVSSSAQIPVRTFTVTNSGAGAYVIDGVNNSSLTLIRGFTYNFSLNAAGHPFWIQTVAGAYSSGNIYNTGITNNGAAVGTITFTVPYDAPDTLYYVCQFHSSMGGVINIKDIQPSGLVSSSAQVVWSSVNYNAGIVSSSAQVAPLLPAGTVSSSAQVQPLLPGGTVSASGQVSITATNGYSTFSSSIATKNDTQDVSINALNAATSSYAINATIQGQLAGVVSSSTQVKPLLPGGTVSASGQVDITATTNYSTFSSSLATADVGQTTRIDNLASLTSSYAINATIQGQLAGVVSSSTQVKPLLPGGTVSASGQVDITATTGYSTFSSSLATVDVGQTTRIDNLASLTSSYAINATIQSQLAGVVSSSTQVKPLLPDGTVSSSAQYPGWVTASSQIDYNSITNKLSGVVSSSTQIVPLLPAGTISASSQVALSSITGTTFATADFTFPQNLTVAGTLTAEQFITEYVSASVIFESGSTKFGDTNDDVMSVTGSIRVLGGNISGSFIGLVSQSAQIDYNSIQNKLSGVVSSSAQVQPLLPGGTVSSSAQYPGWVTSSAQIVWSSVNYNGGIVSSSAQVKPLLPGDTVSSSAQVKAFLPADTVSSSGQISITATTGYSTFSSSIATKNDLQDVSLSALNAATSSYAINATIQGQLAGVVSSSAQVKPLLPGGTVSSSAQYPGWVTASSQVTIGGISGLGTNVATFLGTPSSVNLASAVTDETGTGALVFAGSPTLTGTVVAANITANGTLLLQNIVSQSSSPSFTGLTSTGTVLLAGINSSSAQTVTALSGQSVLFSGSQFSGIVSGSGLAYRLVVPVGTNQYAT